jgi:hypothetical protein
MNSIHILVQNEYINNSREQNPAWGANGSQDLPHIIWNCVQFLDQMNPFQIIMPDFFKTSL